MIILGLSFDYHDAAAALLVDGQVVFAAEEERYSRLKHDHRLPKRAVQAALAHAGLGMAQVDAVVFYEQPMLKFGRIFLAARAQPNGDAYLQDTLAYWLKQGKFSVAARIATELGVAADRIHFVTHHQSHAASAFFSSAFEAATVLTIDGIGEYETASISVGAGNSITQIDAMRYPDSIGLFYSAMTAFLGFEVNEGEYKVMGMAGFGQPVHVDKLRRLVFDEAGAIRLDQRYFNFATPDSAPYTSALIALLGAARQAESAFDPADTTDIGAASRAYADIAASVQRVAEDAIVAYAKMAVEKTGVRALAMAGGVALNSLANGRIQRELGMPLYVHPSPGDAGGALGAALYHHCVTLGLERPAPLCNPLLGSQYTQEEVLAAVAKAGIKTFETFSDNDAYCARVADILAQGKVVGWFQGRFEWGPRALGARSILANPTLPDMKQTINEKIKFRELFRPFAPAVLAEHAATHFDIPAQSYPQSGPLTPEHFMLSVCRVHPDKALLIPAVTHVDGTARVQIVSEDNSMFRRLIEHFFALTGIPVVLNTSFNRRGEPIVATPQDALQTFFYSGLDCLAMENLIVWKT